MTIVGWIDDGVLDVTIPTLDLGPGTGIVLNQIDAYGCDWGWDGDTPFGSKPGPQARVSDRPRGNGQIDSTSSYGSRTMPVDGTVSAPNHLALHRAEQRLRAAVGKMYRRRTIHEAGFEGYAWMRQDGEFAFRDAGNLQGTFTFSLYADDPFFYSTTPHDVTLAYPSTSGGLGWPTGWPAGWTTTSVSGSTVLTNTSAEDVPLHISIGGGSVGTTDVVVQRSTTAELLHLANPNGPLLQVGQALEVDTETQTVLLNGAARNAWGTGAWPMLPPGDSTVSISGTGVGVGAQVVVGFRNRLL
ncbi:MAG: hypothetical protein JWO46_1801 [Nocardioidaceae bacterium]|nr:hypothetical protein [Nocardioidaceae bacterium]